MRIGSVNIYHLALPFKGEFSISIRKGSQSQIVVVELVGEEPSFMGYGEAIPIASATGETPESVVNDVMRFTAASQFPGTIEHSSQIWEFVDGFPDEKCHNAAICALEMALLDLLGKLKMKPLIDFFSPSFIHDRVRYGAPVPLGDEQRVRTFCRQIKALGIRRIRIKMGASFARNRQALEIAAAELGTDCQLRIDPNGVWDRELAFRHLPIILRSGVDIVEEPMKADAPGFREFAEALHKEGILLMACESAPGLKEVKNIIDQKIYQMINVKLCRSGGFRRSLKMIDHIRKSPLSFQVGCTLGESGILSAAGRALCLLSKDTVNCDGSYDRFLLRKNTTVENVSFGPEGLAGPLGGFGLGVGIDRENLENLAISIVKTDRP